MIYLLIIGFLISIIIIILFLRFLKRMSEEDDITDDILKRNR